MDNILESMSVNWESLMGMEGCSDEKPLDDLHLNNAINLDYLKHYLGHQVGYNIEIPSYLRRELDMSFSTSTTSKNWEIGFQQTTPMIADIEAKEKLISFPVATEILTIIQKAAERYQMHIPIQKMDKTSLEAIKIPGAWWDNFNMILNLVNGRSEMRRDGSQISQVPMISYKGGFCEGSIYVGKSYWTLRVWPHTAQLYSDELRTYHAGTFDSVLLLLDTLGQRICLYIANQVAMISQTPGYLTEGHLKSIVRTGDNALSKMGNAAYDIIALFEALCVGILLKKSPDHVNPKTMFLENCIHESQELYPDTDTQCICNDVVNSWVSVLEQLSAEEISNIFCVYRIWGHPVVDIKKGMSKVFDLGTKKKFIPERVKARALLQFRKMFLVSFYRKHHMYPPVTIHEESYVSRCILQNTLIDTNDPEYSLLSFEDIALKKIWDVPETYDIFHILNDKAVSPTKEELHSSIKAGRGTQCGELRRGLWRWMSGDSVRCKSFLDDINEKGLNDNACIIGLYEKEREIKITARMFALMSEEMRYYFVLTEEMIANYVLPYFPEITMKDSLNVLLRKLWSNSKRTKEDQYDVNINIDFSKWNLNMRDELVCPVFQEIDSLFGYNNLIARTHKIFSASYIYSASGKYTPPICQEGFLSDPPMSYTGHVGGFEGLRQKGWTIVTVLLLAAIAEDMGLRINLMGQGDNQVVRLRMPQTKWKTYNMSEQEKQREATRLCEGYIKQIEITFHDAQLPIKVRETWRSCRLFMYGKMMTLDNKTLPQWYKKVLRSYALSNEGVLTFGGVIGTIATNMSSAASTSIMPDIMYVIYLIFAEWSINCLFSYHPFTRRNYIMNPPTKVTLPGKRKCVKRLQKISWNRLISVLILIPTAAGGNITIPLTGFICRGFPDPCSEAYAWIKFLMSGSPYIYENLLNWYSFLANPTIELDQLVQSPLSVNHWKPPTPGLQSRDVVRDWLLSGEFKQNRFIKNASEILNPFNRKEICNELSTDPMSPLVTNELYNIMPHVAVDGVLRRLENTRTVRKMALHVNSQAPVIQKLMEAEDNFLAYIWWRSNTMGELLSECATEQSRLARNLGWGRKIIQVTTPHPLELLLGSRCSEMRAECMEKDHIYARRGREGQFAPYLGSRTKVKVHTAQDEAARKEPLISACAKIARYFSWLNLGPATKEFMERNVRIVCDIDVFDNFFAEDLAHETFTGSIEHRFHPSNTSDGSFINYAPQLGSSIFLSSDYMPTYGRGKTNYTLSFQPLYCFLQYVTAWNLVDTCVHYHLDCGSCIVPTEEDVPDIRLSKPYAEKALSERYHETIRETLGQITKKPNLTMLRHPTLQGLKTSLSDIKESTINHSIYVLLGHTLANKLRTFQEDTGTGVGLEDLQAYPRIYSYKIHVDKLIDHTLRALLFQNIIKNERRITLESIGIAKRRIVVHLSRLPIAAYRDIGSLSLGRAYATDVTEARHVIRSFPETISSYLEGIKDLTIRMLNNICALHPDKSVIVLPAPNLTKRLHLYIILERVILSGCSGHYNMAELEDSVAGEQYPDCKEHCVRKAIDKIQLTPAPLDKMFKEIPLVKIAPQMVEGNVKVPHSVFYPQMTTRGTGAVPKYIIEGQRKIKKSRVVISIPTSSIYKWETAAEYVYGQNIIVLGDGTGGTSLVMASNFKERTVYPCALIEGTGCIPQDVQSLLPPLSRDMPNISHMLQLTMPDDILSDSWGDRFQHEIQLMGVDKTTVISDVEGQHGNRDLQRKILDNIPYGTQVVLKVYMHEYEDGGFLNGLSEVTLLSSTYYNNHYNEVIIIGRRVQDGTFVKDNALHRIYKGLEEQTNREDHEDLVNKLFKKKYKNLWEYNQNYAMRYVSSLRVTMSREILGLRTHEVIGMLCRTLENKYHFGKNRVISGTRRITPRVQSDLCRAMAIVLLVWTCVSEEEVMNIHIQPSKEDMKPQYQVLKPREVLNNYDLKVITILEEMRADMGFLKDEMGNLKDTMKTCDEYSKTHRTYTWSLSQKTISESDGDIEKYTPQII
ncbi:TPA_asm: polyprotein [Asclepias syriaca virus 3]|uniref:Replicase n=1 Tax=Asclepias syriaca virus 3 TaxID=2977955 RepID=A0A9N6YJ68_9RHAB|nr:TPA_asm: polyprotein [Asclepias syriaca virus 3]